MPGMDSAEFSRRSLEISEDLGPLCDDLYAGVDEEVDGEVRLELIKRGRAKLAQFEKFLADLQGVQREAVEKKYARQVGEIRTYLGQLQSME